MRKLSLVLVVLCALAGLPAARAAVCAPPRCIDATVPTELKVPQNHVRIILPAGYDASSARYPVLYLLHGAGDTYQTWTNNTDVIDATAAHDLIVVMPDSGRNAEAGWYSDWLDGSRDWETFHTRDLIAWVDANLRTIPGRRAIAGLSMGGFGAMHHAARHPDLYVAAASFSGALDMMHAFPASGPVFTALNARFGTPNDRVWGNQLTHEQNWRAHNPTDLAARLKDETILIASGSGVPGGPHDDPNNPGGYAVENAIFQMNVNFVLALERAGVAHTDWFYGPGHHDWPYWQAALHWALPKLMDALA